MTVEVVEQIEAIWGVAVVPLRIASFVFGLWLVAATVSSAVKTFVLPRSSNTWITRQVFRNTLRIFQLRLRGATTYADRDRIMSLYAPLALLGLPVAWLTLVLFGFMFIFWGIDGGSLYDAFKLSGSSLFTLGFALEDRTEALIFEFAEAGLGLLLTALLIAYLPTMYAAFQRREALVNQLEVRAGSPPSALEMIVRAHNIRGLHYLADLWPRWEEWFVDVEESHTSLAPLVFFRSPQPDRSWVTAAGTVLDCAAIVASTLDQPREPQAELTIRAGFLALRDIADFFNIPYEPNPKPDDPISIARWEFDQVYQQLAEAGVPLKPDRDQCWKDYAGWRVNYDTVLLSLAALTMAPYAPWSSDRSMPLRRGNYRGRPLPMMPMKE